MNENEPSVLFEREKYFVESSVGKFSVVEVSPLHPKTNIPIIIAPGWSESSGLFGNSQEVLAQRGRTSFVFDHPRKGGEITLDSRYPPPELRRALALLGLIKHSGQQQVDIIAHSEGAVYTTIAACIEPEKFRNLVFIGPAGMIGKDTLSALLARLIKKTSRALAQGGTAKESEARKGISQAIKRLHAGAAKYVAKNPSRALSEVRALVNSDIAPILPHLRDQGMGIVVIHHADDELFPMERIQQTVKPEQINGILAVTGLHDDFYVHPDKYTVAAEIMLDSLEKKQRRFKSG